MSKIKLLLNVVEDLRSLANDVQDVADAMMENEKPEPEKQPAKKEAAPKPVKLEEVRAVLAEKSHDGFTAEVRELLTKYGADKLSKIDPASYADLLKDAEVIGNAT